MNRYEEMAKKYGEESVFQAAFQALKRIKEVLDDEKCFWRIEAIVNIFEELGSDGGSRHDF